MEKRGADFGFLLPGLMVLAVPLTACLPERALSSYVGGAPSGPALTGTPRSDQPDAQPPTPERDAGGPAEDAAVVQDAALPDAGLPPGLLCREECVCERRGEREFMFCGTEVSFDEALERCGGAGGTLVSIDDEEQNAWLGQRMQELEADDYWLSGTDAEVEGVWRWIDGRVFFGGVEDAGAPAAFAPWGDGQPNDLNGEDCLRSTGGVWVDLDCGNEIAFVCEG